MRRFRPKRRRSQARRRRTFRLTVPVIWGQAGQAAVARRPALHATSWRWTLRAAVSALLTSPRWISLSLLVGIVAVLYSVRLDQTYVVSSVEVSGTSTLSPEAVVQASGIEGVHAFFLNPAEAARRVAEIPSVLTATVRVGWPSRAHITVAEREPVMVWDQVGGRFWVDKEGRLMQARQESGGLLVILSQEPERLSLGYQIPADVLAGALQLRRERPNIASLFYERGAGLSYQDGRSWRVYFGAGRDMNQKLSVYETLVENLQAHGLHPEYISVVNKEKPFYRLSERTG